VRPPNSRPGQTRHSEGFTIIEVLVAVALFAIVVLVILAPLTGLFGLTQRSTQQVSATNAAQQVIEQIRGQWLDQVKYSKSCVDLTLPSGVTVTTTVQDKNVQGTAVGTSYAAVVGCSAAAVRTTQSAIHYLTVNATSTGGSGVQSTSALSVEVARP